MAGFLVVRDPDPLRRRQVLRDAAGDLAPDPALPHRAVEIGDVSVLCLAPEALPADLATGERGLHVVLGEPRAAEDGAPRGAALLAERWAGAPHAVPAPFDGWHVAIRVGPDGEVLLATDRLGFQPVVHWTDGEVLLVASGAEPFRRHPRFRPALDPVGLCGVLLVNGLVAGRSLWQGVRRLAPGHVLHAPPRGAVREVAQYAPPRGPVHEGLPFDAQVERVDRAVRAALRRLVPADEPRALLLSGGLDSRLLAAEMVAEGRSPVAVTYGLAADLEVRCARRVARRLGLAHRVVPDAEEDPEAEARTEARLSHLAAGFSMPEKWSTARRLAGLPPRTVSGYAFDAIVGPHQWVARPEDPGDRFPEVFANLNHWGLAPDRLRRLLRPEAFGDAVEETLSLLRSEHDAGADTSFHRAWLFYVHNRQRHHVGSLGWMLAFHGPPVLPIQEGGLLDAAFGMPPSTIFRRRLETALIVRRFPDLARLPLDRNSHDTRPLLLGPLGRARWWALRRVALLRRARRRWLHRHGDPRRFYRLADPRSPRWRRLREVAQPRRREVAHLFRPEVLDEVLPPAGTPWRAAEPIGGAAGARTLLGFLLWSEGRLG